MPSGVYRYEDGRVERFSCGPDDGGWRYSARRSDGGAVELRADGLWRPTRLEVTSGERVLRGGAVGPDLLWVTAGAEHSVRAAGFVGESPGLRVAVARSLKLAEGESADVRLLAVSMPALATRPVPQRWTLAEVTVHDADGERLPVECYEVADLETGEMSPIHLAGDVLVAAPGIELVNLENPPTLR